MNRSKIILYALIPILTAACELADSEPSEQITVCDKHETVTRVVPSVAAPGYGISVGGLRFIPTSICVRHHLEQNPAHLEWVKRHYGSR